MTFDEWLAQADEWEKRTASEYRHHYPVENEVWVIGDTPLDEPGTRVVECGCNQFGYEYGSPGHNPGDPPYVKD